MFQIPIYVVFKLVIDQSLLLACMTVKPGDTDRDSCRQGIVEYNCEATHSLSRTTTYSHTVDVVVALRSAMLKHCCLQGSRGHGRIQSACGVLGAVHSCRGAKQPREMGGTLNSKPTLASLMRQQGFAVWFRSA